MRRTCWCLVVISVSLVPQSGCLSGITRPDPMAAMGVHADPNKPAAKLPPDESAKACMHIAQELEKGGHLAQAANQYELARQHNPRLKGLSRRLAVVYDRLGMTKQAQDEYHKALLESPRDANLLNNYGFFHYSRARWQPAEEQFRKALAIDGKHKAAWNNLGLTLAQQERYTECLDAFGKTVGPAESLCNLAVVLTEQGKRDEARQAYQKALQLDPELQRAQVALAKMKASEAMGKTPTQPLPPGSPSPKAAQRAVKGAGSAASLPAKMPLPPGLDAASPGLLPADLPAEEQLPDLAPIYVPAAGREAAAPNSLPALPY